jgi:hypothetical protein
VRPAASATTAPAVKRGADRKAREAGSGRAPARARLRAAPPAPRRVSGPALGIGPGLSAPPITGGTGAIALGLAGAAARVSRHRLLDRLIWGRTWIAFVAFALIGIVTMQLGLLKLNGGIGRALEHEALLQRENAALSIEDSELAADSPVQSRAARIGMELAPLSALVFLTARPGADPTRAATVLATSGQSSAPSASEGSGSTAASTSAEPGSASSASSESASAGAASSGAASESAAAGAPAGTSHPSEATSGSPPEASARPAAPPSAPSSAGASPASAAAGAGGGEAASGGGTGANPSGG